MFSLGGFPRFVNLEMLEVNGFDFVEALKGDAATACIPIVVVTAKDLTPADRSHLNLTHARDRRQGGVQPRPIHRRCGAGRSSRHSLSACASSVARTLYA